MTDITDQDRRIAREWATTIGKQIAGHPDARTAARVILATVDAPEPTLAEAVEAWAEKHFSGVVGTGKHELLALASRAEQMENDLAEASAEVGRLTAKNEELRRTDNYKEFRDKFLPVQKAAESNAETPDPADVKPGEVWIVECRGERRTAVKDRDDDEPWNTVASDGLFFSEENENVTLLHRLVPAPRVITDPDELDKLAEGSIVRDNEGDPATRRAGGLDYRGIEGVCNDVHHYLPVTVLWEPGA